MRGGKGKTQGRELPHLDGNWPKEKEERVREPACAKAQRFRRAQFKEALEMRQDGQIQGWAHGGRWGCRGRDAA